MTKHLRIFMLTLLTLVCALGGYAEKYQYVFTSKVINSVGETQLGDINWTLTTSNGKMYANYICNWKTLYKLDQYKQRHLYQVYRGHIRGGHRKARSDSLFRRGICNKEP